MTIPQQPTDGPAPTAGPVGQPVDRLVAGLLDVTGLDALVIADGYPAKRVPSQRDPG